MDLSGLTFEQAQSELQKQILRLEEDLKKCRDLLSHVEAVVGAVKPSEKPPVIPVPPPAKDDLDKVIKAPPMASLFSYHGMGLTPALYTLFDTLPSGTKLNPVEVRRKLIWGGFGEKKNLDVMVATQLRRMVKQGVLSYELIEGKRCFFKK